MWAAISTLLIRMSFQSETNHDRVSAGVAGAITIAALASAVRTRLFCEQLILPKKAGRGRNWILIRKNQVKQLFQQRGWRNPAGLACRRGMWVRGFQVHTGHI